MTRRLVAIIGGGVSGFAAAYELKRVLAVSWVSSKWEGRWHDAAPQLEVGHLDLTRKLEGRQAGLAAACLSSGQLLSRVG